MIGWLLARPRLALYGLAGAALLAGGITAWVQVSRWRSAYVALPAVAAARDAAIAARQRSERAVLDQVAHNQEIERELTDRFVAADARARDLARRLLQAGRPARPVCPAPAAASPDDGAGREPDDGGALEAAVGDHLAACDRDAARLTGLQAYVRALPQRCVVAGE